MTGWRTTASSPGYPPRSRPAADRPDVGSSSINSPQKPHNTQRTLLPLLRLLRHPQAHHRAPNESEEDTHEPIPLG